MTCWLVGLLISGLLDYKIPAVSQGRISVYDAMSFLEIFCLILKTNSIVGLLCCYLGYISGGFITIIILLYNGYLFGMSFFPFLKLADADFGQPLLLIKLFGHVPFEIISFSLFGALGLGGFEWLLKLYANQEIELDFPGSGTLILPFLLLVFATTIEAYAIYS